MGMCRRATQSWGKLLTGCVGQRTVVCSQNPDQVCFGRVGLSVGGGLLNSCLQGTFFARNVQLGSTAQCGGLIHSTLPVDKCICGGIQIAYVGRY